jgi:hypothetical protein
VKRHTRLPSLRSLADRRANRGSYERIKFVDPHKVERISVKFEDVNRWAPDCVAWIEEN